MALDSHNCPQCGAPVETSSLQCEYCGTWFDKAGNVKPEKSKTLHKIASISRLPSGAGEFGISSRYLPAVGALIAFILYIVGWFFEDTQYWLDETAMTIWIGALPLWLFVITLVWRSSRGMLVGGLVISLIVFVTHVAIILMIRGRLWDDHIGIAVVVAVASLIGWFLGRLVHSIIRWRRAQPR